MHVEQTHTLDSMHTCTKFKGVIALKFDLNLVERKKEQKCENLTIDENANLSQKNASVAAVVVVV